MSKVFLTIVLPGTLESASLFRTLKEKKLTESDQRILRLIMETNGISEKDIILNLRTNIFGIGTTLKSLYSRSIIARYFKIRTPALLVALSVTANIKIDSTTETAAIAA